MTPSARPCGSRPGSRRSSGRRSRTSRNGSSSRRATAARSSTEEEEAMTTTETTGRTMADAERPLWIGQTPATWGDVVRSINPEEAHDAASMIAAAGLDWSVEQHPLEAVVEREYQSLRVPVPRHVANVRSDTRAVLGVV